MNDQPHQNPITETTSEITPLEVTQPSGERPASTWDSDHKVLLAHMLAHYDNLPITAGRAPVCSWSLAEPAGRARLHQCIAGTSRTLWDEIEKGPVQIVVSDLASNFAEFEDEARPGEVISGPKLYLIGPNGTWQTGSTQVYFSLQQLALLEGRPPWDPPCVLQAERVSTRNKRVRISLTLLGRGEAK